MKSLYPGHQLGKETETQAEAWFLAQGNYRLLSKNFRCKMGEIDLIFEHGKTELVFVEVKGRSLGSLVDGIHSIDWKKKRRLHRTIQYFMTQYRGVARTMRLDVLAKDGESWTHLPNVW